MATAELTRQQQLDIKWLCALLEYRLAEMKPRERTLTLKFTRGAATELLRNLNSQRTTDDNR